MVSNLKRDKYPGDVSSLEEDRPELDVQRSKSDQQQDQSYPPQDLPQGQAPMAAQEPQQAPSSEAMQQSSPDPAKDQPDLQHAQAAGQATAAEQPDQQAGSSHQEASSESNWLDATASDVLQHSTAQPQSTAHDRHSDDSALRAEVEQFDTLLQRTAENPKLHHLEQRILRLKSELGSVMKRLQHHNQTYGRTVGSAPGPDPMSKGETDSGSSPVSLNDLYAESDDKTLSKGGPVPAGQVCINLASTPVGLWGFR